MARHRRRASPAAAPAAPSPSLSTAWIVALFAAALAARVLFWSATPDRSWPHSAFYKGDALLWLDYATALERGQPFELGVPLHPPGTAWLVSLLWDGTAAGVRTLKLAWCALGAAVVALSAAAAARAFGPVVGLLAGALLVGWTPLLVLSTSVNVETPYLLLAVGALALLPERLAPAGRWRLALWGGVNALACLFRVEHVLFAGAALVLLGARAWRTGTRGRALAVGAAVPLASFVAVLAPWHAHAWSEVRRVNTEAPALPPGHPAGRLAGLLAAVPWEPDAVRARDAWPAFVRETAATFVAATVVHRGGDHVRAEDVRILEDAFGPLPRALAPRPFVSSYGGLNLALAFHPAAGTGFDTAALEEPPPLRPSADAYPPDLVRGLPPPQLALSYPGHLALVNDGGAIAWRWIRGDPPRALRKIALRLGRFWMGATSGFTGYGLPGGVAWRPAVDAALGHGPVAVAWSLVWLAGAVLGIAVLRTSPALAPWLLFLGTKAATAAVFFGYARLGGTAAPVVAVLAAAALARELVRRRPAWPAQRVAAVAVAALVALELTRWAAPPLLRIDGRPAGARDPWPADDHLDRSISTG